MSSRVCSATTLITKLTLWLGLMLAPAWALAKDLDRFSDQQLDAALFAELDDESLEDCGLDEPNAAHSKAEMYQIVMCALGDAYDDDPWEQSISLQDLREEMAEAGYSLEAVVSQALAMADNMAAAPLHGQAVMIRAAHSAAADLGPLAKTDGWINPASAVRRPVIQAVKTGVRAR
jgi:hypothetical protein